MSWKPAGPVNPWIVTIVISLATFMEVLDTSIANVSLSHIAGGLGAGLDESTWVLTTYLVANAVMMPISGWLGTVLGLKRLFLICVVTFTVSSLLCGLAPSMGWLLFFRVLQGVGGAGMAPVVQAMLADIFPPEKRGLAFAVYGLSVVFAPAIGPTLGGWITDNYSWHWIFLINVPVGILSVFLTWLLVSEPAATKAERERLHREGFSVDWPRLRALRGRYRRAGIFRRSRRTPGLVFLTAHRDHGRHGGGLHHFAHHLGTPLQDADGRRELVQDPELRRVVHLHVLHRLRALRLHGAAPAVPRAIDGLHGAAGRHGAHSGRHRADLPNAVRRRRDRSACGYAQTRRSRASSCKPPRSGHMTSFSLQITFDQAVMARVFQVAGMSLLFIPITRAAYDNIPPGKNNGASALINLARNLGGSVGIALSSTVLAQRAQFHQSRLVENISDYDTESHDFLQRMADMMASQGSAMVDAQQKALQFAYQEVLRQASMLSYIDVFMLMRRSPRS